jgi:peptidoglycan/LPS O-acetylase OafA/YrhL
VPNRGELRADIEGLRGVAVGLVVLFHARLLGVGGGYVGVDAFYVLSGFLITGLLLSELAKGGTIDLAAFYARRARRILPAATVAIVATLSVAAFVVAPLDLPTMASDATASALFASNIHFALRATDYFGPTAPSPFLHYWSLAVEEQFYFVWPVLLLIAARARKVGAAIAIVFVLSLGLAIVLTPINGPWSFYILPTRAWELALGGLIAVHRPLIDRLPTVLVAPLGWAGLALVGLAAFTLDAATPYPGTAALLPTVGVALLIAGGERRFGAGRLLAVAPLRGLGRISYSVYLYHWPVLILAAVVSRDLSQEVRWALAGASLIAGAVSWRLVEEPFRRARSLGRGSVRTLALAGAAVVVVAVLVRGLGTYSEAALTEQSTTLAMAATPSDTGLSIVDPDPASRTATAPAETPPAAAEPAAAPAPAARHELRPRLADARQDGDALNERGCGLSLLGAKPPVCQLGASESAITVALVGDSHAAQWAPALEEIAGDHALRLVPFTKDSCIFLDMRLMSIHLEREYVDCASWRKAVVLELKRLTPDLIVVSSSRWVHPVNAVDADTKRQAEAMARLLRTLPGQVVILADTPLSAYDVPACLSKQIKTPDACATKTGYALTAHLARDGLAAELAGVPLIDPTPWLCDEELCPAIIDWTIVYRDDHHLTATFARSLAPRLLASLAAAAPALRVP